MNKIILVLLVLALSACTTEPAKNAFTSSTTINHSIFSDNHLAKRAGDTDLSSQTDNLLFPGLTQYLKKGVASWYGPQFHGRKTASGEIFDMYAMTAAHRTLPIPSYARVTNLENQRSVVVRVNDRGPFRGDRMMDLSYAAAKELDLHLSGSASVEVKAISPDQALAHMRQSEEKQKADVYLHIGSFGNKKKALHLRDKIAASHLPQPEVLSSKHKGSTLYKVQLGPIKSAVGVHEINLQLAKLGITATPSFTTADQKAISMIQ